MIQINLLVDLIKNNIYKRHDITDEFKKISNRFGGAEMD